MNRVVSLVDGFNLYHSIKNIPKYKWLDLNKLSDCFITKNDKLIQVYYFTSIATWDPNKAKRHRIYIKALRYTGVKVIEGEFKYKDVKCLTCNKWSKVPMEKQTDVNIATQLFKLAYDNVADKILIISGDSDLAPAIKMVRSLFRSIIIKMVFPKRREPKELKQAASNNYSKIKKYHLDTSLLPKKLASNIYFPAEWQ